MNKHRMERLAMETMEAKLDELSKHGWEFAGWVSDHWTDMHRLALLRRAEPQDAQR